MPGIFQHCGNHSELQKGKELALGNISQTERAQVEGVQVIVRAPVPTPSLKSIIIGPVAPRDPNDPLATIVPSLLKTIDENALQKIGWDYMDTEDEEMTESEEVHATAGGTEHETEAVESEESEEDVEVLESPPPVFMTSCKKKSLKIKEKLDDSICRCSKRISNKLKGFEGCSKC